MVCVFIFAIKHIYLCSISAPLKLSAPTALMQNANTDATLVCHANKPYDECLWTTPYGKTYRFPDQNSSHEKGRIAYFGFADTDCGIIVRNVSKDPLRERYVITKRTKVRFNFQNSPFCQIFMGQSEKSSVFIIEKTN